MHKASHMKTTIDISDPLLRQAKKIAATEHTTLRALIEAGLRKILEEKTIRKKPFQLKQVTFKGDGLQPQVQMANWEQIRALAYEEHGG